jgi:hypothetical protein
MEVFILVKYFLKNHLIDQIVKNFPHFLEHEFASPNEKNVKHIYPVHTFTTESSHIHFNIIDTQELGSSKTSLISNGLNLQFMCISYYAHPCYMSCHSYIP